MVPLREDPTVASLGAGGSDLIDQDLVIVRLLIEVLSSLQHDADLAINELHVFIGTVFHNELHFHRLAERCDDGGNLDSVRQILGIPAHPTIIHADPTWKLLSILIEASRVRAIVCVWVWFWGVQPTP